MSDLNNWTPSQEEALDELVEVLAKAARHSVTVLKIPLIGFMTGLAVGIFSGSFSKAVILASISTVISCFRTWRRFLEPLSFWMLVAAAVYWCGQAAT